MARTKVTQAKSTEKETVGKQQTCNGGIEKPHRYRPGAVALRDVKKYQKSAELVIKKVPFRRLVDEISQTIKPGLAFKNEAMLALQVLWRCFVTNCM